jgi:plastocyanin
VSTRNILRLVIAVASICITTIGVSQSREHFNSSDRTHGGIVILDVAGRAAPNSPPSPDAQTVNVTVAPGGSLTFSPSTVNINAGDVVKWTWAVGGHSVTSGGCCTTDNKFCSPSDTNCGTCVTSTSGTVYQHTFNQSGTYSYYCCVHGSFGMVGTVNVAAPFVNITSVVHNGSGFVISGLAIPNATVTIQASPDLVTQFGTIGQATANNSGVFQFTDPSATSLTVRFYHVTYP